VIVSKDGYVELTPVQAPDFAWMAFTVPMVLGTDLEGKGSRPRSSGIGHIELE